MSGPATEPAARSALPDALAPLAIVLAAAFALHLTGVVLADDYFTRVLIDMAVFIIAAVSLTIVNGFTGQFSIGHAAFVALGGYASAFITYYSGVYFFGNTEQQASLVGVHQFIFLFAAIVGGLVAAGAGWLVGLPSLRLRGDYLAIVTLGFGEILRVLLQQTGNTVTLKDGAPTAPIGTIFMPPAVGGSLGFSGIPPLTNLFWAYLLAATTVLCAIRLKRSSTGLAMLSIREDEIAAESMGVNVTRLKVRAFMIGAFFAGIAGAVYAHTQGVNLAPQFAGFARSFDFVMIVVLGGLGSISGAILGAVLFVGLTEWLRAPTAIWYYVLPIILARGALGLNNLGFRRHGIVRSTILLGSGLLLVEILRSLALHYKIDLGEFRLIIFALALILLMIFRPQGLFGLGEIWDLFKRHRDHEAGAQDQDPGVQDPGKKEIQPARGPSGS